MCTHDERENRLRQPLGEVEFGLLFGAVGALGPVGQYAALVGIGPALAAALPAAAITALLGAAVGAVVKVYRSL